MWVFSSGWIEEVIATPRVKSAFAGAVLLAVAAVVGLRADQRLGVGAGELAEPVGDAAAAGRCPSCVCSRVWVP